MTDSFDSSKQHAIKMDSSDSLAEFRNEFYLTSGQYYLDGNSLGLLSKRAEQSLLNTLEDWKTRGINGWTTGNNPWFYFSEKLGSMLASLLGADEEEVIATGSTTVNLHQLVASFYQPKDKRTKILADELTFPSDIYALQSQLDLHGYAPKDHLLLAKSNDGNTLNEDDIIAQMSDDVALIVLPSVLYRSGQLLDMEKLTHAAHERNIIIGFDLAHSIGALPHELSRIGADFAFWCNYKHLNAGPGSVGGLYVNRKHFQKIPGLTGWFSSDKSVQFDMTEILSPAEGAGAFQIGTPHILSMAPLLGSLEMFLDAGILNIRDKSLRITHYLLDLIESELNEFDFKVITPTEDDRRGGHISLQHIEAARICKAMKAEGVIPDFRAPNMIRLAPVALYTSYEDVWQSVNIIRSIMENKTYEKYENTRDVVA